MTTPTPTDARDVEIATADFEYAVRNANETLGDTVYLTKAVVLRILNRLSASESRNAELERENEWRGLVLRAMARRTANFAEFHKLQVSDDGIPLRPDDATVAKIRRR